MSKRRFGCLVALLALAWAGCAWIPPPAAQNPRVLRVSARVTLGEQIALPAGAVLDITLRDLGSPDSVVARYVIRPETGTVPPIRFVLEVDSGAIDRSRPYGLSATIVDAEERLAWTTGSPVPISLRSLGEVEIIVRRVDRAPPSRTTATRTLALDCGGVGITVHLEGDKARVVLQDRTLVLDREREAASTRYSQGGSLLVVEGGAVFLNVDGRVLRDCETKAPAAR